MNTVAEEVQVDTDPLKYFWYLVYLVVMIVTAIPLFVTVQLPQVLDRVTLLLIHEFAGFLFIGHTLFSNIWAMRIRMTQPEEAGIWARGFLRKLALSITFPMSIISPGAGLLLMEYYGGLSNNPWAWDAYFAFWLMAGISIVPDVIRYGRNRNAANPKHGIMSGAIRGNFGTVMVIYILWCMIAKGSLVARFFIG
ncbi:MAG: hypothetical protein QGH93_08555 [Gammaproteobacteria bacterium]|jgi:hypothetical protein|nr:hypothetical protein [Chromatiales bacterium]MDP6674880.1 hypothetical protein [Gammaproteobacteria bacterium]